MNKGGEKTNAGILVESICLGEPDALAAAGAYAALALVRQQSNCATNSGT
jgi:hypothetical protein